MSDRRRGQQQRQQHFASRRPRKAAARKTVTAAHLTADVTPADLSALADRDRPFRALTLAGGKTLLIYADQIIAATEALPHEAIRDGLTKVWTTAGLMFVSEPKERVIHQQSLRSRWHHRLQPAPGCARAWGLAPSRGTEWHAAL
jgi:hypothetical protein